MRIACFGGIYNNYLALEAAIASALSRGVDRIFCLGDMGAFGPYPDRVFPFLHEHKIECLQGNYDDSIGNQLEDCQCGYTDPRDNYFAEISYRYTLENTSEQNRRFLRDLPKEIELDINGRRVLLCHGSPRKTNEFLWESTSSTHFLTKLAEDHQSDVIVATHSGIKWHRPLPGGKHFVNAGVLGRPENDGTTNVWYTIIEVTKEDVEIEFVPVDYDHERLAQDMIKEGIPQEFVETIMTGWWSTCLEILPSKERRLGRF